MTVNDLEPKGTGAGPTTRWGECGNVESWKPLFAKCSTHNLQFSKVIMLGLVKRDFWNFVKRITQGSPRRSAEKYMSPHNNFVCLTPDLFDTVTSGNGDGNVSSDHEIVKMLARRPGPDAKRRGRRWWFSISSRAGRSVTLLRTGICSGAAGNFAPDLASGVAVIFTIRSEPDSFLLKSVPCSS